MFACLTCEAALCRFHVAGHRHDGGEQREVVELPTLDPIGRKT